MPVRVIFPIKKSEQSYVLTPSSRYSPHILNSCNVARLAHLVLSIFADYNRLAGIRSSGIRQPVLSWYLLICALIFYNEQASIKKAQAVPVCLFCLFPVSPLAPPCSSMI